MKKVIFLIFFLGTCLALVINNSDQVKADYCSGGGTIGDVECPNPPGNNGWYCVNNSSGVNCSSLNYSSCINYRPESNPSCTAKDVICIGCGWVVTPPPPPPPGPTPTPAPTDPGNCPYHCSGSICATGCNTAAGDVCTCTCSCGGGSAPPPAPPPPPPVGCTTNTTYMCPKDFPVSPVSPACKDHHPPTNSACSGYPRGDAYISDDYTKIIGVSGGTAAWCPDHGNRHDVEFWELNANGLTPVNITSEGSLIRTPGAADPTCNESGGGESNWYSGFCSNNPNDADCNQGFEWTIPARLKDGLPHYIVIYGVNPASTGKTTPLHYSGPQYTDYYEGVSTGLSYGMIYVKPLVVVDAPNSKIVGHNDTLWCNYVKGWAGDTDDPDYPIDVEVWDGEKDYGGTWLYTVPGSDQFGFTSNKVSNCSEIANGNGAIDCNACLTAGGSSSDPAQCVHEFNLNPLYSYIPQVFDGNNHTFNLYGINKPETGGVPWQLLDSTNNNSGTCPLLEPPWWQAKDADITAKGAITSKLPTSSAVLIRNGSGGYPGVAAFGTTLTVNQNGGKVSSPEWSANSVYNGKSFFYSYFNSLIPNGVTPASFTGSLTSGGTLHNNYYWYKYDNPTGTATLNAQALGTRKVILFVNGNLKIDGSISLTNGQGFLLVIASGDITVNSSVGDSSPDLDPGSDNSPELKGLFFTDKKFITGTGANQFYLRGSVVANNGLTLGRSLADPNNTTRPAEYFEYAPDQILNFPKQLAVRRVRWLEVAP